MKRQHAGSTLILLGCWCVNTGLKVKVQQYWCSDTRGFFESKHVEGCVCFERSKYPLQEESGEDMQIYLLLRIRLVKSFVTEPPMF